MKIKDKTSWFTGRTSNILYGLFIIGIALFIKSGDGDFYYHWGYPVARST
jgi:hypothetical protein